MIFGVRGHDIVADSVEELVEKCVKTNVKTLQLALKKSVPNLCEGMFTPTYAKKLGEMFSKNGIDISVLGCYINPSNTNTEALKKDLDFFVENLKYAKFMNVGMVGLETGFVGDDIYPEKNHTEEAYQYLLKNMRYLCDAAEKLGVMIGIEGVHLFVINSVERMRRLLDDLNSPNICVIFDPLNLITNDNYKEQDKIIDDAFTLLRNELSVVHLKDFKVEDGKVKYVLPGEGIMNIKKIFEYATKYKPELPIMLEGVVEADYPVVMERLQKIIESI